MLVINKYTCPINKKITIMAHLLDDDLRIVKSYPKMVTNDLTLFQSLHDRILICEVIRSANLDKINVICNK